MKSIGFTLQRTILQKLQKKTLCDIQLSSLTSALLIETCYRNPTSGKKSFHNLHVIQFPNAFLKLN